LSEQKAFLIFKANSKQSTTKIKFFKQFVCLKYFLLNNIAIKAIYINMRSKPQTTIM